MSAATTIRIDRAELEASIKEALDKDDESEGEDEEADALAPWMHDEEAQRFETFYRMVEGESEQSPWAKDAGMLERRARERRTQAPTDVGTAYLAPGAVLALRSTLNDVRCAVGNACPPAKTIMLSASMSPILAEMVGLKWRIQSSDAMSRSYRMPQLQRRFAAQLRRLCAMIWPDAIYGSNAEAIAWAWS
jgi:hypothetical protein